jgi:hypothetical protein
MEDDSSRVVMANDINNVDEPVQIGGNAGFFL